jgi:hypothetical protein
MPRRTEAPSFPIRSSLPVASQPERPRGDKNCMATHPIVHGLVLTVCPGDRNDLIAICSDGSPQLGHEDITVLSVERVNSVKAARDWFRRVKKERPWETRN